MMGQGEGGERERDGWIVVLEAWAVKCQTLLAGYDMQYIALSKNTHVPKC